jgi:phosphonate transport system substrate-binding protein
MVSRTLAVAAAMALVIAACSDTAEDAGQQGTTAAPTGSTWPESLIIGFVPEAGQEGLEEDIEPLVGELQRALGMEVEGVVAVDHVGLSTALGTDNADLGVFGPFEYVVGKDQFGNFEALLQATSSGSTTHHGQWFTNDPDLCDDEPVSGTALENQAGSVVQVDALDATSLQVGVQLTESGREFGGTSDDGSAISPGSSCIGDIGGVAGKRIAFTSETSPSGYLLPAAQLVGVGLDPEEDVDPMFAGSHEAAVAAVHAGEADVGLSFDDARRSISDEQPEVGQEVIVFGITPEIPNDVLAVRSDLPQSLKDAVHDAVVRYLQTEEGAEVFAQVYGWTELRAARESDFDIVREAAVALDLIEPPG